MITRGGYKSNELTFKDLRIYKPIIANNLLAAISLSDKIDCVNTPEEYFKKLYKLKQFQILAYRFLGTNCGKASGIKTKKYKKVKHKKSRRYKK